jgi:AcrR family transcriptional regulator
MPMDTHAEPAAPPRAPLTRERVLRAAVDLADRDGIAALTMRRLGQQLGVEAMSLYNHVADKDDLLDGMADLIVGEIGLPPRGADWKAALHAWAVAARVALSRHPWALWLAKPRRRAAPVTLRYHDAVIGCLREAGFSVRAAAHAYSLLRSYTYGFTLHEQSLPLDSSEEVTAAIRRRYVREIPAEQYPYLVELLVERATRPGSSFDREFAFGLELILDGLERVRDTA